MPHARYMPKAASGQLAA